MDLKLWMKLKLQLKIRHFYRMNQIWKSKYCQGEKCRCGNDAIAKVGEEIFDDDPNPIRHNFTAYICKEHFEELFGIRK